MPRDEPVHIKHVCGSQPNPHPITGLPEIHRPRSLSIRRISKCWSRGNGCKIARTPSSRLTRRQTIPRKSIAAIELHPADCCAPSESASCRAICCSITGFPSSVSSNDSNSPTARFGLPIAHANPAHRKRRMVGRYKHEGVFIQRQHRQDRTVAAADVKPVRLFASPFVSPA